MRNRPQSAETVEEKVVPTAGTVTAPEFAATDVHTEAERANVRRPLVPTTRGKAAGDTSEYIFRPDPVDAKSARPSIGRTLFGQLEQMDIRKVAGGGPMLPLVLLGYLNLVEALDGQAFGLLLPEIKASFGFSVTFLLALGSAVSIMTTLMSPAVGFLADRVKRVWLLRVGALFTHAQILAAGFAPNVPTLAAIRAAGGVGGSLAGPVGFPLMCDYYPPSSRGRVFSFLFILGGVGGLLGPIVAGGVGSALGWQRTLIILGGLATFLSLSLFLLREPVRGRMDRLAMGATEEVASQEQRPVGWSEGWRAAGSITTLRRIWIATVFGTVSGGGIALLSGLLYVQKFHLTPIDRGLIGSLTSIPALAGLMVGGPLTDRILAYKPGRLMVMLAALNCVGAVGLVVFVFSPYLWLTVAFNIIPTFTASLLLPSTVTLASLIIPARLRAFGLQTTSLFSLPGLLLLPFVVGPIADSQGLVYGLLILIPIQLTSAAVFASSALAVERDIRAALAASMADEEARRARDAGRNKMLICRDIDVTYDGAQVLFNVDFDVEEGEIVALLGTNGAGKSTLLRAISGIQPCSNGAIFLDGDDITHVPPHQNAAKGVVMMPGGRAVFPTLTVNENLTAAAWMYKADVSYVKQRTTEVLELFPRLRERLTAQAGNMSGGEQQMLALGQALLMRPRLLMIDELSLGLAPSVVQTLLDALRRIHEQGTTIIIVEQSVNVALSIARRAVYMEKGQIRFDGPTEALQASGIAQSVFLGRAVTSSLGNTAGSRRSLLALDDETREDVLEVSELRLNIGGVNILNGVSLHVAPAEVVGLIGPNGAGKTTLFDVITGFQKPTSGSVALLGQDVTRTAPDARARMGLARSYQNVRLFPALTVRENIAVALERHLENRSALLASVWSPMSRRSERKASRRIDNYIDSLGLGAYADKFMNELSTGSRRIVDIACLLASQPRLLLLDEPSSGLAQAETESLAPLIGRIVKEAGCGVLIIEHDLGLVASASDRIVALRLGAVMTGGPPAEVLANPEVIEAILGGASEAVISRTIKVEPAGAAATR